MSKKDDIIKGLEYQESIEGQSFELDLLKTLINSTTDGYIWNGFTTTKHVRYGKLLHEYHKFYYPTKEFINLCEKITKLEKI